MATRKLQADYLVVGSGAAGMAFTDALITDSDATVVMVDRRHAPGGHWNDAYPFVRLHQPSAYYGVNSLSLGSESIDTYGSNQGFYERASAPEICAYFDRVMQQRLLSSGRVRYFPLCEYLGENRFVSRGSGDVHEVQVQRRRVDATYLEPSIPATCPPPFEVASDARCVPVNELPRVVGSADGYVIVGSGKTSADACLWLLGIGVPADDIRWIKPRECWYVNRVYAQGGEFVETMFEGLARQMEASAQADSIVDLMHRLEAAEQLLRIDEAVEPTMFKGATASRRELEELRRIREVVRLGRVRRIERDAIVLDDGEVPTSARHVHVHCAAHGLNPAPGVPMFRDDRVTLQPIRTGLIPFNAALVGFIEATRDDTAEKNRLCPTNPLPDAPLDWVRGTAIGTQADYMWSRDPEIADWLERARLNPSRGIRRRMVDPKVQRAAERYARNARPALARLQQLAAQSAS